MKKVRIVIDGYVEVPEEATKKQIEDAVHFQLGLGSMGMDNPVGEPDWDYADVNVYDD